MSNCCSPEGTRESLPCMECGTSGTVVGPKAVRPHQADAVEGPWQHCATNNCDVVYHLGADTITADQLRTQVGMKGVSKPTPVCFCFSYTADDLADDLEASDDVSSIKAAVKAAVADGFCACLHLNPSGRCCLPNIHQALKKLS